MISSKVKSRCCRLSVRKPVSLVLASLLWFAFAADLYSQIIPGSVKTKLRVSPPRYYWYPPQIDLHEFTNVWTTIAGSPTVIGSKDGADARFYQPFGLAMDWEGNLLVTDALNHTIRRMSPKGSQWVTVTIAGTPGLSGFSDGTNDTARFNQPTGIAADTSGNLFVADTLNNTIRSISFIGTNAVVTTIAGLARANGFRDGTNSIARFNRPLGIAVDRHGTLYVTDSFNHTVREIRHLGTNWIVKTIAGWPLSPGTADGVRLAARFNQPAGIACDPAGNLYVADQMNATIRELRLNDTNWVVKTIAGYPGVRGWVDGILASSRFGTPLGISIDAHTNLYVTDTSNNNIREMTWSGTDWLVGTLAGSGIKGTNGGLATETQFSYPSAIAVTTTTNGILYYVADSLNDTIRSGGNTVTTTNYFLGAMESRRVLSYQTGFLIRAVRR